MQTPAGKVAEQACKDEPDLPTRTLARNLRNTYPELFASIDDANRMIRYYRGNLGGSNRTKRVNVAGDSLFKPNGKAGVPIPLPKGITQKRPPLVIPPCKALILNDIHAPYHNHRAIQAAVQYGLDRGCDTLYLNGDTIDFYSLSRFVKDPRNRDPRHEVDVTIEILTGLAPLFKTRYYKVGNHDERWDIYLFQRAADLVGFDEFDLQSVLNLQELGYTYLPSKQWATFSKFALLHGHEFARGIASPVNPARGVFNRINATSGVGHFHRSSNHTDTHSLSKKMIACWSFGCLCDLTPEYLPINKWNLGFATIDHDGKKFQLENLTISPTTYDVWSC